MYFRIIFFLLLTVQTNLVAQNTKLVDSLKKALKLKKEDDSLKIRILTRLHEKLMFSNPEEARGYALQELEISKRINYEYGIGLGHLHLGDYHFNKSSIDSAKYHYHIAKSYFKKTKKIRGLIFVDYTLAEIFKEEGDYDTALKIFHESINIIEDNVKPPYYRQKFLAGSFLAIGACNLDIGKLHLALSNSLKALDLYEKIDHKTRKADALKQVGDIEKELGHLKLALNYYEQALKIYKDFEDIIYITSTNNAIGKVYKLLGDFNKAEKHQLEAISLARQNDVRSSLSSALNDLGDIYITREKYDLARKAFDESRKVSEKENIILNIIDAYKGLSTTDYFEKKHKQALKKIEHAIALAKASNTMLALQNLYSFRATILESLNRNKEAIFYLKEAQKVNDSILSIKKTQQIEELKTIYESEKKEAEITFQKKEIETLSTQAKNDKLTKTLYSIGMFSFIAIAGLIYFSFKQRIKKNKIAREKQEEILKQELAFKKKELASQTLHLVQKNTFINELKENLERIKQSPQLFKIEFRRLVMLLRKESAEDKNWEVFKSYFSKVHNNFDIKLKEVYADITEKEIRLASFLRMHLSTKEIASMLNVLPESVSKSKYRLKKKLNLDKETDLNTFLSNL